MRIMFERCAGLDVHKKTVVACVITPEGQETKTFGTMTADLLRLSDWLLGKQVSHVAMESTGVYWKPVYNLLEGLDLTVWVVNAQHIKNVPGRKTDAKDAEWIAECLQHGMVRGSLIPDRPGRELRELVRHRRSLIRQQADVVNRIQKLLEGANIKLASVASNVVGASGRAMLEALARGEEDPEMLAGLAKGLLRKKRAELALALRGLMGEHQRMMLKSLLRQMDFYAAEIEQLSEEVARRTAPLTRAFELVDTIPGINRTGAEDILAETGTDMQPFPTAGHLASWSRVCPANNESGGKRKSGRIGHANRWLRSALSQAAWAAAKKKGSYLQAQYKRLAARRGHKRALIAVAHTILVMIYHVLRTGRPYEELGGNYFDERNKGAIVRRHVARLEHLGYEVTLVEAA